MSEGFTPGPWSWDDDLCVFVGPGDDYVVTADWNGNLVIANPADAAMIEAAPDMYEALENMIGAIRDVAKHQNRRLSIRESAAIGKARAALRKAEGAE